VLAALLAALLSALARLLLLLARLLLRVLPAMLAALSRLLLLLTGLRLVLALLAALIRHDASCEDSTRVGDSHPCTRTTLARGVRFRTQIFDFYAKSGAMVAKKRSRERT